MAQKEKVNNNPVFYLGIGLLCILFIAIFCSIFVDPNILTRFTELGIWQDVEKMVNIPAKIVGYAFAIFMILLTISIAAKIADYGIKVSRAH